jgi:hypothetical protein
VNDAVDHVLPSIGGLWNSWGQPSGQNNGVGRVNLSKIPQSDIPLGVAETLSCPPTMRDHCTMIPVQC